MLMQRNRGLRWKFLKKGNDMKKTIGTIYQETDYSVFRKLVQNRELYEGRVGKLMASLTEKTISTPILVNEKMEIIDGQGRFEARKRLGLPIPYYIVRGLSNDDCIRLNQYNSKWNDRDFAVCYSRGGNENYIRLLKLVKETGLTVNQTLGLANKAKHGVKKGYKASPFQRGELIFTAKDEEKVKNVKKAADELIEALAYNGRISGTFLSSVRIMLETSGYNHPSMIRNCKRKRSTYAPGARIQDQIAEFERIYNDRRAMDKRLYFSDYMRNKGSNVREYKLRQEEDVSTL